MPEKKITRQDLEQAFHGLVDDGHETVLDTTKKAAGIAGAFAFLGLVLTYVLGRRRGSKAKATVEIRRI